MEQTDEKNPPHSKYLKKVQCAQQPTQILSEDCVHFNYHRNYVQHNAHTVQGMKTDMSVHAHTRKNKRPNKQRLQRLRQPNSLQQKMKLLRKNMLKK